MTDTIEVGNSSPHSINNATTDTELTERSPLLNHRRRSLFENVLIGCLIFILIVGMVIGARLLADEGRKDVPETFIIIKRQYWDRQFGDLNIPKVVLPIQRILLLQTDTNECWNKLDCSALFRNLKKEHMEELGEPYILYNFMIASDGLVYEGRGWQYQTNYPTSDNQLVAIAFAGNYEKSPPQLEQLQSFLDVAVMRHNVIPCFNMLTLNSTARYLLDIPILIKEEHQNGC